VGSSCFKSRLKHPIMFHCVISQLLTQQFVLLTSKQYFLFSHLFLLFIFFRSAQLFNSSIFAGHKNAAIQCFFSAFVVSKLFNLITMIHNIGICVIELTLKLVLENEKTEEK